MCVHAAAYYFSIVWFEIKLQIDLNLHFKIGLKIRKEKKETLTLAHSRPVGPVGRLLSRSAFPSPGPVHFPFLFSHLGVAQLSLAWPSNQAQAEAQQSQCRPFLPSFR